MTVGQEVVRLGSLETERLGGLEAGKL